MIDSTYSGDEYVQYEIDDGALRGVKIDKLVVWNAPRSADRVDDENDIFANLNWKLHRVAKEKNIAPIEALRLIVSGALGYVEFRNSDEEYDFNTGTYTGVLLAAGDVGHKNIKIPVKFKIPQDLVRDAMDRGNILTFNMYKLGVPVVIMEFDAGYLTMKRVAFYKTAGFVGPELRAILKNGIEINYKVSFQFSEDNAKKYEQKINRTKTNRFCNLVAPSFDGDVGKQAAVWQGLQMCVLNITDKSKDIFELKKNGMSMQDVVRRMPEANKSVLLGNVIRSIYKYKDIADSDEAAKLGTCVCRDYVINTISKK